MGPRPQTPPLDWERARLPSQVPVLPLVPDQVLASPQGEDCPLALVVRLLVLEVPRLEDLAVSLPLRDSLEALLPLASQDGELPRVHLVDYVRRYRCVLIVLWQSLTSDTAGFAPPPGFGGPGVPGGPRK